MSLGTLGVRGDDAGVASAAVNTVQQVGGSVGTALLNTLAASAATTFAATHLGDADVAALSAVHSYTVAFTWSAAVFAVGAIVVAAILRSGVPDIESGSDTLIAV
jgi:hypothetical protein